MVLTPELVLVVINKKQHDICSDQLCAFGGNLAIADLARTYNIKLSLLLPTRKQLDTSTNDKILGYSTDGLKIAAYQRYTEADRALRDFQNINMTHKELMLSALGILYARQDYLDSKLTGV